MTGMFSRSMYSQTFSSVQCSSGWMRMCVPFSKSVLNWSHSSGRLVLDVPLHVLVARAEIAFLGAGRFLVAAHADDHAGEMVLVEHLLERVLLQRAAALDAGGLAVRDKSPRS